MAFRDTILPKLIIIFREKSNCRTAYQRPW